MRTKPHKKVVRKIHLSRSHSGELIALHKHKDKPDGTPVTDTQHIIPEDGLLDHVSKYLPPSQQQSVSLGVPKLRPNAPLEGEDEE